MDKLLSKISNFTFAAFLVLGGVILFCALVSLPFWLLWNWLIPDVFGLPEITWLQSFGLWLFVFLLRNNLGNLKSKLNETDGTETSPFGDHTWNQWVEQVRKKYQA